MAPRRSTTSSAHAHDHAGARAGDPAITKVAKLKGRPKPSATKKTAALTRSAAAQLVGAITPLVQFGVDFRDPARWGTQVAPCNLQAMESDLRGMGFVESKVMSVLGKREKLMVDGFAQRPFSGGLGLFVAGTGLDVKKGKAKSKVKGYQALQLGTDPKWTLFDPLQGFQDVLGKPPAAYLAAATFTPDSTKVLEINTVSGSVRLRAKPSALDGKIIDYTITGPKITEIEDLASPVPSLDNQDLRSNDSLPSNNSGSSSLPVASNAPALPAVRRYSFLAFSAETPAPPALPERAKQSLQEFASFVLRKSPEKRKRVIEGIDPVKEVAASAAASPNPPDPAVQAFAKDAHVAAASCPPDGKKVSAKGASSNNGKNRGSATKTQHSTHGGSGARTEEKVRKRRLPRPKKTPVLVVEESEDEQVSS